MAKKQLITEPVLTLKAILRQIEDDAIRKVLNGLSDAEKRKVISGKTKKDRRKILAEMLKTRHIEFRK